MKRGRKKLQTGELKVVEGAPATPEDIEACPAKLQAYTQLIADLDAQGNLQATDGLMIALCARTLARLAQVEVDLDKLESLIYLDSRDDPKPHPLLGIQATLTTKVEKLLSNLRLSPATRSKALAMDTEGEDGWEAK